ncbi:MAG: DsbA family protein [Clostridiales bacterium]|nr:DsbA family protein [Clostridiales bacterium]
MKDIIITNFTDPVCVWCWAMEPVFRALETRYPGVEVRYVMGGLVRDIDDFADPDNGIDAGSDGANRQIVSHWLETYDTHRMPIRAEGFHLFSQDAPSTYPQNIAYKAAQIASPRLADRYLRLLRAATFTRALVTSRRDVQVALAREAGLDVPSFERALDDGSAGRAFQTDLGLTQAMGVSSFPTFQVKSAQARQMVMRGYNRLADFERVFSELTGGALTPLASPPDEDVLRWLYDSHGPLTMEEIYRAFDFDSREESDQWVDSLAADGRWARQPVGQSALVLPAEG